MLLLVVWAGDTGISLLVQHSALKNRVTARLSAAFGRQVEVRNYSFSIWSGPVLEAHSVVVAEDPRFGNEYFLRAESLTVRIAWRSLVTGRLELGTVSLWQPTLNLVRSSDGAWNLAEWLPRPANFANPSSRADAFPNPARSVRFHRIDVDEGRVNFKLGDDKLPFAFSGIKGTLATENSGQWRLDLLATPLRAGGIVQQSGMIRLVGDVGGTSSRLRPAALQLSWNGATVPDVLRLIEGRDYGVRGNLNLSVAARTEGDAWLIETNASIAQLHRWDLGLRGDNPFASIVFKGKLDSDGSHFELRDARIDAPHSSVRVLGAIDWSGSGADSSRTRLRIVSAGIGMNDLLAWARAFHQNISDNVSVNGFGHADLNLSGWPLRIDAGTFDLPRVELSAGLHAPVRAGPIDIRYDAKRINLAPTTVTFGGAGLFRVEGSAETEPGDFSIHMQGSASQAGDVISLGSQLGWNPARGWDIAGPMRCDLLWRGTWLPRHSELAGTIEWGSAATGASLHAQFLNLPVEQIRGRAELKPMATHVTLSSAQAFGTHWTGTFDHELSDGWRFALSADELSAANLDRWLNPQWRESFLDRLLPFLNSHAAQANVAPEGIRARGSLTIDTFALASMPLRHLRGDVSLDGRHLEFSNVIGQFAGGEADGSLSAEFLAAPEYRGVFDFSELDLRALSAEFPSLADLFDGVAFAKIAFTGRGANRSDLVASLDCRGTAHVTKGTIAGINLSELPSTSRSDESEHAAVPDAATGIGLKTSFSDAAASFVCANSKIEFQNLLLRGAGSDWNGAGTVDFSHNLDLRFVRVAPGVGPRRLVKAADGTADEYRVTGSLTSPRVERLTAPNAEDKH